MSDFRQVLAVRQVRNLKRALASLAGVTRHEQDPHAVRLTLTTVDGDESLGALNLSLIPLTELVDAIRARTTDLARQQKPEAQPAQPGLRLVDPARKTNPEP